MYRDRIRIFIKHIALCLCIIFSIGVVGCTKISNDYMDAGDKAFKQKDYKSAINFYKKEIRRHSQNAKAYSHYCGAKSYLSYTNENTDLEEALSFCDKALSLDKNAAETYFYKGRIYTKLNKNKEAENAYTQAINIAPNYSEAYINRGIVRFKLRMIPESIEDYSKAIKESKDLIAYVKRAYSYLEIGKIQNAKADFKIAAQLNVAENDDIALIYRAEAKNNIGDYTGAIFDIKKAIDIHDTVERYYLLASSQALLKDNIGAIETCTKGIKKYKNNSESLYMFRGYTIGIQELYNELSNGITHDFTQAYSDFQTAQKLALKNNNQSIYEESNRLQKSLTDMENKVKSITPIKNNDNSTTLKYKEALDTAKSYSNSHMSKTSIYRRLTKYEGFTEEEAQYAIDNLNADYKSNALAVAVIYYDDLHWQKSRIYRELIEDRKFTEEEAQYAIDNLE